MRRFPFLMLFVALILVFGGCSEDYYEAEETAGDAADEDYAYYEEESAAAEFELQAVEEYVEEPPAGAVPEGGTALAREADDGTLAEVGQPAADTDQPTTETETLGLERMMVYETEMTVLVEELDEARDKVEELVDAHHKAGVTDVIITSVDVTRVAGTAGEVTFEIRCHKDERVALIRELRDLGEIVEEFSTAEDITKQYVDAERRRDKLQRDYDIKKAEYDEAVAAGAPADELRRLDEELNLLDYELSEAEGKLKNFDDLVTLPRITITLTEDDPGTTFRGGRVIRDGFEMAYIAIVNILRVFIIIIGVALVLAILGVPIYLLARRLLRSRKGD
jgi:hypothetical protein